MTRPARVLSVAGSDPSGGAGIQGDLKTFSAFGVFGMAAVTACTVQTPRGVRAVHAIAPDVVGAQVAALLADCPPDAIKIGMFATAAVARGLAGVLRNYEGPVVLDPVLVATSGDALAGEGVLHALTALLPFVTMVTPNLHEAGALLGRPAPTTRSQMLAAGQTLLGLGPRSVLVKGGHLGGHEAADVLVREGGHRWFTSPVVRTDNAHGTGCALSSAVAARLAQGAALEEAVADAKAWLSGALHRADALGPWSPGGRGPVDHLWRLRG